MRGNKFHEWNEGTKGKRESIEPNPVKQQTPDANSREIRKYIIETNWTNEITGNTAHLSVTLNVNGLSSPIKRHRWVD